MVLSPAKGSFVLDMCAAPGGKTAHLAQLMDNTGLIIANELFQDRHLSLGNTLDRLGVVNTVVTAYQAQQFPLKEPFDFILADVPCSGEGTLRGSALKRLAYSKTVPLKPFSALQKKIILRGFDLLKKGGEMLYSTCTYNPDENEEVVDFLLKNRQAELLPINLHIDFEPGITQWRDKKYDPRLVRSARFYPHQLNSVGFFMARIGRR
jgi:16S rRNA C967 or C1407 C5-methylase (RsmB/RsmF family)